MPNRIQWLYSISLVELIARSPKLKKAVFAATLSVCSMSLCACAVEVYRQAGVERLTPSEVAAIVIDNPTCWGECVQINQIDGVRRGIGVFGRYELTPGSHKIVIGYFSPQLMSIAKYVVLDLTVESGHSYRIRPNVYYDAQSRQSRWSPEVFDAESGRVVSKWAGTKFVW